MEINHVSDQELLNRLNAGDVASFEEIYERYWKVLFVNAHKRLKDSEQSKDAVQDVFTDLWKRRNSVSISNLSAYLHTAVRFQVYKIVSREKVNPGFFELFHQLNCCSFAADNQLREKEFLELLDAWLDALPEKRREIVLLHLNTQLSTQDIAVKMEISQKTVQNQWGTAIRYLKTRLASIIVLFHI